MSHTYHRQYFWSLSFDPKFFISNALNVVCSNKKIDKRLGLMWKMKKNQIFLILMQKFDYPINGVIMQEPVWKWRHNNIYYINKDPFSVLSDFKKYSTFFAFSDKLRRSISPFVALTLYFIKVFHLCFF